MPEFSRTLAAARRSVDDGLNPGVQLCVRRAGAVLFDAVLGEARAGVPMRPATMITWWSMTKPVTAVAIGQQWERGLLELDDPVARHVPEFGVRGKQRVTVRHLLTHTGGFRGADRALGATWDEQVAAICAAPLEPRWEPGHTAGYHLSSSTIILAEVVRRCDQRPFERYVREEIFLPLGMLDCWVGMPPARRRQYGELIGTMHDTSGHDTSGHDTSGHDTSGHDTSGHDTSGPSEAAAHPLDELDSEVAMARCAPASGGRGPMDQLIRLYQAMLDRGALDGVRILSAQTVEAMTARHRVGLYDKTFGAVVDWGLGWQLDSYSMGPHCSPRAFGHGGSRSSVAFADPEHGLAVAILCNGMPAVVAHQQRMHALSAAIYADLGLAQGTGAQGAGRDKPLTRYA